MEYTTIISTQDLYENLFDPSWVIIDCRFSLAKPEQGRSDYLQSHIPGAVYAHLNEDLSGEVIPGKTGRHPLPPVEKLTATFNQWGIDADAQVVVYDDAGGSVAARAWWMLRWLGHESVAVLDGGWQHWLQEIKIVQSRLETKSPREFKAHPRTDMQVSVEQVEALRNNPAYKIFDARTKERFQGRNETIDPVAGHIPGVFSAPYARNLAPNGTFRPKKDLYRYYKRLIGDIPPQNVIFHCGSGVTACHNFLAMLHASLGDGKLFVGSWSQWIADSRRPITA
jgi:thiosulfate/3-mercaptopyruvate sulfurtransferase